MENVSKGKGAIGSRYSDEVRERVVRAMSEHGHEYETRGAAIRSIAWKMGISREKAAKLVIQTERDRALEPARRRLNWPGSRSVRTAILRIGNEIPRKAT
jgi:transposase